MDAQQQRMEEGKPNPLLGFPFLIVRECKIVTGDPAGRPMAFDDTPTLNLSYFINSFVNRKGAKIAKNCAKKKGSNLKSPFFAPFASLR
jgi:hypothetical protein